MRGFSTFPGTLSGAALALLTTACGLAPAPPHLLETLAFYPDQVGSGDTMRVVGRGFPESRHATVTFLGTLYRPGEEPVQNVEIKAPAIHALRNALDVELTDALERAFCGATPVHTTFRGDVVGAFTSLTAGSQPVTGRARDVVLDVHPRPVSPRERSQREAEGQRLARFLGLDLNRADERQLFQVVGVVPEGRAERAGLEPGDELVTLDGVTLRAWSDFVPSGRDRRGQLVAKRPNSPHDLKLVVDVEGFNRSAPTKLLPMAFLILLFGMALLILRGPLARGLSFIERQAWLRRHAKQAELATNPKASGTEGVRSSFQAQSTVLGAVAYLVIIGIAGAFAAISLSQGLIRRDFDLLLLFGVSMTVLLSAGAVSGGWVGQRAWSLGRGLLRAAQIFALQLPLLSAFVCIGLLTGSLDPEALGLAQGGLPWEWRVFFSPLWLGLATLGIACLIPRSARDNSALPEAVEPWGKTVMPLRSNSLFQLVESAHLLIAAGVLVSLFFGGWRLPGASPAGSTQELELGLRVLSALFFQFKIGALVWLVLSLRRALPRVDAGDVAGWVFRGVLPTCLGAVLISVACLDREHLSALGQASTLAGPLLFATTVLVLGLAGLRVLTRARMSVPTQVNPWL